MAYTAPQIGVILLKADRTMYKIGQIAYENMFAEDNEALDYERDVIFIYKKAVEFADDFFVGTEKLDKVVERLATKISAYDYGELNPIYADAATVNIPSVVAGAALNDLTDVTIANLLDNQFLRYNAATGQWINVGPGSAVRSSQAFIATAGQTVFTTSAPFDAGLFDLYVNGVKLNSLSYTTFGEYQITLNDPCAAGDIVDVVIYDPNTGINPTANTLNDLTDVNIGPLANKQGLYYNSASGLWENGLVFVPYTGATAAVDLGEFEIRAGQFTLDTSPTGTATVGTTRWNDSIGSSETTLKGGSVILKNGVDLVARVVNKVTPNTTLTKASYAAVRISGAQGQRLAVAYAQANNDANSADTIGLVTETIATNQEGFIMTMGSLEGINTTGSLQGETWADGDVLYLSPTVPGRITNVKPTGATGHIVVVGYVEYAHANNGKIYVKTMNGWELDELHNVNINTGTLANGDVLKYNSTTQLWENGVSTAGISGSGASGQVTYWTGASAVSGSNNLFWSNSNGRLGINTNNPTMPLDVLGNARNYGSGLINYTIESTLGSGFSYLILKNTATSGKEYHLGLGGNGVGALANSFFIYDNTAAATRLMLSTTGNLLLNGTSDGGQRLQVYGDTLLRGSGATSATTALTVQNSSSTNLFRIRNNGDVNFGSDAMYWDALNSRLGIGVTSPTSKLYIQDASNATVSTLVSLRNNFNSVGTGVAIDFIPESTNFALSRIIATRQNLVNGYTSLDFQTYDGTATTTALYIAGTANRNIGILNSNPTARLDIPASVTTAASLRIRSGTAPTTPNDGDIWYDSSRIVFNAGLEARSDTLLRGSGNTSATTALTVQNSSSTDIFRVRNDGQVGVNSVSNFIGRTIELYGATSTNIAYTYIGGVLTTTTGSSQSISIGTTFQPTSGASVLNTVNVAPAINQTGGANGITRGLYVNPTLTAAADFRAIETTAGNVLFGASGTGFFWDNANSRLGIGTNAPTNSINIVNGRLDISGTSSVSGSGISMGYLTGIYAWIQSWVSRPIALNPSGNNVTIGVSGGADNGQRLQVYGDTLLRGSGSTIATTALTVQNSSSTNLLRVLNDGDVSFGADAFYWDAVTSRLGIGTNSPQEQLHISNSAVLVNTVVRLSVHPNHANIISFRDADGTGQGGFLATGSSFVYGTYVSNQVNLSGAAGGIGLRVNNTTASNISFYGGNANGDFGTKFFQMTGSTGNFILQNGGTFSDGGQRLQVIGDTLLRGSGATSATTALTVQNSSSTNLFTVLNDGSTDISAPGSHLELRQTNATSTNLTELYFYNSASSQSTLYFTQNNRTAQNNLRAGHFNINGSAAGGVSICATDTGAFVDLITDGFSSAAASKLALRAYNGNIGIGTTPTAALDVKASTTTAAAMRFRSGTAPTTPNDGDIWFDGTDIKMRIGGVTKTFTLV